MGRLGIRIANVALFTLCCFQSAVVFNKVTAELLMPVPTATAAAPVEAAWTARGWEERQPILDRNLFGAKIVSDLVVVEPEPEDLEETKLPVRLLGTQVHSRRENSKAAISDKGGRNEEVLYEGDTLDKHPSARLVRIERRRVILQNDGRREELLLEEAEGVPPPQQAARRPRNRRRTARAKTPAPLTDRLRELQLERNEGRSTRSLFSQAKIIPKWQDGQMVGMELREIEPGSLYDRVGLSDGDVIKAFNGVELDSAAAGGRVLSQFAEADEYQIELGSGEIVDVPPEELRELLEGGAEE